MKKKYPEKGELFYYITIWDTVSKIGRWTGAWVDKDKVSKHGWFKTEEAANNYIKRTFGK